MKKKKTQHGVDISSTYGMKERSHDKTWIVVAHRAGAQIFNHEGGELSLVRDFPFPEGKSKESKLVSDRPGRSFNSWSGAHGGHQTGAPRHAISSEESPADHAMTELTETIAKWLESSRKENKFEKLLLVAEPRFIGRLKSHLPDQSLRLITAEKEKDYSWLKTPELEKRLLSLFPGKHAQAERILPEPRGASFSR